MQVQGGMPPVCRHINGLAWLQRASQRACRQPRWALHTGLVVHSLVQPWVFLVLGYSAPLGRRWLALGTARRLGRELPRGLIKPGRVWRCCCIIL